MSREGEKKKRFGVCVKGMSFPTDDLTLKIMEWIEVLKSLGVDTIFLYDLAIHPNVKKLLKHYVEVQLASICGSCWLASNYTFLVP